MASRTEIEITIERNAVEIMALLVEAGGVYLDGAICKQDNIVPGMVVASDRLKEISQEIKTLYEE